MQRLVLFDIDATLLLTGGAGQRAMTRAFEALFGAPDGFAGIPMAGRTDPAILAEGLRRIGRSLDDEAGTLERFRAEYCRLLREEMARPADGKVLMPGVRPLVEVLARRDDVFLALLTGNFAEGARVKLDYFGLWSPFRCGAFGDDDHDRAALVPIARARAEATRRAVPFRPTASSSSATRRSTSRARSRGTPARSASRPAATTPRRSPRAARTTCSPTSATPRRSSPCSGKPVGPPSPLRGYGGQPSPVSARASLLGYRLAQPKLTLRRSSRERRLAEAPGSRTQPPRRAGGDRF